MHAFAVGGQTRCSADAGLLASRRALHVSAGPRRDANQPRRWSGQAKGRPFHAQHAVRHRPPGQPPHADRQDTARCRGTAHRRGCRRVDAIRRQWKGPLLIKGLLSPADAKLAREMGVDEVILSNRGKRQFDHAVAPQDVLPEVAAKKSGMAVVVDSGIRRGTDVLKAMALGADFTFVGRPFLFVAALGGVAGVEHATRLLREEVDRDMGTGDDHSSQVHGGKAGQRRGRLGGTAGQRTDGGRRHRHRGAVRGCGAGLDAVLGCRSRWFPSVGIGPGDPGVAARGGEGGVSRMRARSRGIC